jgi:hypothetical protein
VCHVSAGRRPPRPPGARPDGSGDVRVRIRPAPPSVPATQNTPMNAAKSTCVSALGFPSVESEKAVVSAGPERVRCPFYRVVSPMTNTLLSQEVRRDSLVRTGCRSSRDCDGLARLDICDMPFVGREEHPRFPRPSARGVQCHQPDQNESTAESELHDRRELTGHGGESGACVRPHPETHRSLTVGPRRRSTRHR